MYCIYRITNKLNGHTYIGQHKYSDRSNPMKRYKGSGMALQKNISESCLKLLKLTGKEEREESKNETVSL